VEIDPGLIEDCYEDRENAKVLNTELMADKKVEIVGE
jgi:hypothetical protein